MADDGRGKDRPPRAASPHGRRRGDAAPQPRPEAALAVLWQPLLNVAEVPREAGFFSLGGHSLLATQLVSRIAKRFGIEVPLRSVFDRPAPPRHGKGHRPRDRLRARSIAAAAAAGRHRATARCPSVSASAACGSSTSSPAPARSMRCPMPCASMARSTRFALRDALDALVSRHEALRDALRGDRRPSCASHRPRRGASRFPSSTSPRRPTATLWSGASSGRLGRSRSTSRVGRCCARGSCASGGRARSLALTVHHIVSDGHSASVMFADLAALYAAAREGAADPADAAALQPLTIQPADVAVWQASWREAVLEDGMAHWRKALEGAPERLALPTDRPRPAIQTFAGAIASVEFGAAPLAPPQGARGAQRGDALPSARRSVRCADGTRQRREPTSCSAPPSRAGPTMRWPTSSASSRTPSRCAWHVSPAAPFTEHLKSVREATTSALHHQHVPFERIVEELAPARSLAHGPLVQVTFTLQSAGEAPPLPRPQRDPNRLGDADGALRS